MTAPAEIAVERIRRAGPLRFDEVVDLALYADEGFFTVGGGAGRRADFITSPEVGSLYVMIPRLYGQTSMWSTRLIDWHFWTTTLDTAGLPSTVVSIVEPSSMNGAP